MNCGLMELIAVYIGMQSLYGSATTTYFILIVGHLSSDSYI